MSYCQGCEDWEKALDICKGILAERDKTIAELRERQAVIAQKWLNVSAECDELRPIKAERDELRSQLQRERAVSDELAAALKDRKCTCNGTGLEHKSGYTHYETDAGEECPAYHYGPCPRCKLASAALAQHEALRGA